VLGLAEGTLPDDALQAWVQQDRFFVVEERRVVAALRAHGLPSRLDDLLADLDRSLVLEPSSTPPGRVMAVSRPQPWSLIGRATSIPSAWRAATVAATSSVMRYSSARPPSSAGWTASSAGGSAKISQPPPASTDRVPSTLASAERVASASSLYRMAWAPLIMAASSLWPDRL
jgi:hypothetical protein